MKRRLRRRWSSTTTTTTTTTTSPATRLVHYAAPLLVLFVAACKGEPDACERLQPTIGKHLEQQVREAFTHSPSGDASFGGMFNGPSRASREEREIAHVRSHFIGACRKVGATELVRCFEAAQKQRALPPDAQSADDPACRLLGKAFEAALYPDQ